MLASDAAAFFRATIYGTEKAFRPASIQKKSVFSPAAAAAALFTALAAV